MAGILLPAKSGGAVALESVDVTNMFVGTIVVDDAAQAWQLTVSTAALDATHKAVNGVTGLRWVTYSAAAGGGGVLAAWFATTLARMQTYDATLTDVVIADEMGQIGALWDPSKATSGTVSVGSQSSVDIQAGTTSAGNAALTWKDNATVAGVNKIITNLRTARYAMAVRVTKIANVATSDNRMSAFSDGATANVPRLGIIGGTSQTNYAVKCGAAAAIDTTVAQSAVGTYDTLILLSDGTNLKTDINGAAPAAGATQAIGANLAASPGFPQLFATQAEVANSGFRVDKVLVVVPVAA